MSSESSSITNSGGLSSESEDIPSYSYSSGVTESYRNWDGEESPLLDGDTFSTIISILGGVLVVAVVLAILAAVIFGAAYFVKQRKAKKAGATSAEYVLM